MPARTAEARLSTASGHTSRSATWRRRRIRRKTMTGAKNENTAKQAATAIVEVTSSTSTPASSAHSNWAPSSCVGPTPSTPAWRSSSVRLSEPAAGGAGLPLRRARAAAPDQQQPGAEHETEQRAHVSLPHARLRPLGRCPSATTGRCRPPRTARGAAGSRRPASSRPSRVVNMSRRLDDVALDPPGTATISRTRRWPRASMPRCTTRSTLAATVGTTNAADTFSPASSGSVHILTSASRAEFACSVHMPGRPLFSAISRSRHSSCRTSPTISRLRAHAQRLLHQPAQRDLAGALEVRLPGLHRDDVRQRDLQFEDLLDGDDPLARRDRRAQRVQQRGLAGLGSAGDQDVQARRDARLEEPRRLLGQRADRDQLVQRVQAQHELADVDGHVPTGDLRDHDVQPRAVRQHRVDERGRQIDRGARTCAASARRARPPASAVRISVVSSERPRRATNTRPGSLIQISSTDRIVEERLQRAEPGHRVERRSARRRSDRRAAAATRSPPGRGSRRSLRR